MSIAFAILAVERGMNDRRGARQPRFSAFDADRRIVKMDLERGGSTGYSTPCKSDSPLREINYAGAAP